MSQLLFGYKSLHCIHGAPLVQAVQIPLADALTGGAARHTPPKLPQKHPKPLCIRLQHLDGRELLVCGSTKAGLWSGLGAVHVRSVVLKWMCRVFSSPVAAAGD